MSEVIIHTHPDLDAIACAALSREPLDNIHFVPAGAEAIPDVCPCHCRILDKNNVRVLDHPLGEKGQLDGDGTRHAAVCSMPEAEEADPDLLAEIDEHDSTGKVNRPRFSLARIIAGLRELGRARGYRGADLELYVTDMGMQIIRGLNLLYKHRKAARERIDRGEVPIVTIGPYQFAIFDGNHSPEVGLELAERGVCGAIFQDRGSFGVTRYPEYKQPDLRLLADRLPGWFIHTSGFLACWGTRKNPITDPPPDGTPQNTWELIKLLREVYG